MAFARRSTYSTAYWQFNGNDKIGQICPSHISHIAHYIIINSPIMTYFFLLYNGWMVSLGLSNRTGICDSWLGSLWVLPVHPTHPKALFVRCHHGMDCGWFEGTYPPALAEILQKVMLGSHWHLSATIAWSFVLCSYLIWKTVGCNWTRHDSL